MTTYSTQPNIIQYLNSAKVDDIILTRYESNTILRAITSASPTRVNFENLSRYGSGSYDSYSGSWDCEGVLSLEHLGNGLDNVKQSHPELFI